MHACCLNILIFAVSFIEAGKPRATCKGNHIKATLPAGRSTVRVEVDAEHTLVLSAGQHQFMTEGCLTFITVTGRQTLEITK